MEVHGTSGTPVVLLPGGAAPCAGFFPGLVEGLVADPGCRVVVHDRPGTGSAGPGELKDATAHLHNLVTSLGMGPVVVVGQSLGGAVATLWARDHPDDLAGIVLLDSTPITDPVTCARIERPVRVAASLARLPVVGKGVDKAFQALGRRTLLRTPLPAQSVAAVDVVLQGDVAQLAAATRGLGALAAGLNTADLPLLPSAVVTADRAKPDAMSRSHEALATAFGATVTTWPGATHTVQLDHPDEVLELVRDVIRRAHPA
jgi:pimeloyl-ACP methyl ester carboxylesterase